MCGPGDLSIDRARVHEQRRDPNRKFCKSWCISTIMSFWGYLRPENSGTGCRSVHKLCFVSYFTATTPMKNLYEISSAWTLSMSVAPPAAVLCCGMDTHEPFRCYQLAKHCVGTVSLALVVQFFSTSQVSIRTQYIFLYIFDSNI